MSDQLKEKMIGALAWSSVDRVAQQAVQFIIGIVLARLLEPADYGLMGIVMIFAALSYVLVESGYSSALVRTQGLTSQHTNTVFYTNLGISALLYLVVFFFAPLIGEFFADQRLVLLTRVTFLAVIFNALYLVPYALAGKEMDYQTITKVNLFATVCSGATGIVMAFNGFGVWALAIQQIGYHFFRMTGFYFWTSWRPKLQFSLQTLKGYTHFSTHMLGSSLLNVIFNKLYTTVFGKIYSQTDVGYYNQADKMSEMVLFTFQAILSTTYNLFARIQDQSERIRRIFRLTIKLSSLVTIPVLMVLIVAAEPVFFTLFGSKWMDSVPYFQWICAAHLWSTIYIINGHALNSVGKSHISFRVELFKRALTLITLALGLYWNHLHPEYTVNQEIVVILMGFTFSCTAAWLLSMLCIRRHFDIHCTEQLHDLLPGVALGVLVSAGCYGIGLCCENLYLRCIAELASAVLLYLGGLRLISPSSWFRVINYLREKRIRKTQSIR
ncbi:MAG: lipopolysaccharide biosynthesis protein [Paludibacteraceae bacterium]|nr:lipopolysaccharide biosynthesis protein [Paludibacteraceae bacterium]